MRSVDCGDSAMFRTFSSSLVLNQGLAGFDRTHTFQFYSVYQLPFGKGHSYLNHGFLAQVVGGFQIGGTVTRYTGLPFTVTAPNSSLNPAAPTHTPAPPNTATATLT